MKKLITMYFSPTGTTEKILEEIEKVIVDGEDVIKGDRINFTYPQVRKEGKLFSGNDILLIGVPVYAGRVPNILLNYLNSIKSKGSIAIPIVLYGNRDYDDALLELNDILVDNGFHVIAGGAFVGEHSFSYNLAKDRPDSEDLSIARDFGRTIYEKIKDNRNENPNIKGKRPYRKYYIPKDEEGKSRNIIKVKPKTDDNCIDCKICAKVCTMGSIDYNDVSVLNGICIKCGGCIKRCPVGSKYFDDPSYIIHKEELEDEFKERKEPIIFI